MCENHHVKQTKKELIEMFKKILNSYQNNSFLNTEDYDRVYKLIHQSKNSMEKIGCGIQGIKVIELKFKNKCFKIVREDLTEEIFSYVKIINQPKNNLFTKFSKACRNVVQEDLRNVKQKYFDINSKNGEVLCQKTNKLYKWESLHVDHREPHTFSVIVDRFIELNNIDLESIKFVKNANNYEICFEDFELMENFKNYHKSKAVLRIIHKNVNLGKISNARIGRNKKDNLIQS